MIVKTNIAFIILLNILSVNFVHFVSAECCKDIYLCLDDCPDIDSYSSNRCDDGSEVVGSYCGVGPCNIFGCNCDGGCRRPYITIFKERNQEDYPRLGFDDSVSTSCVNIASAWNDQMSSVDSHGHCARLYEHADCHGRSLAVHPGSVAHNNLDYWSLDKQISSIGPCLRTDNDAQESICSTRRRRSTLTLNVTSLSRKRRQSNNGHIFACDLLIFGFLSYLERQRPSPLANGRDNPIEEYQRGHGGRVEFVRAHIFRRHLDTGTTTNARTRNYARHEMGGFYYGPRDPRNDQAGHIIADRLGGTGRETYNIFPQSAHFNTGVWRDEVEGLVYDIVNAQGSARYEINLYYTTETATRPYAIGYRIVAPNGFIIQNDMTNPEGYRE